jgi:hypothetical protein
MLELVKTFIMWVSLLNTLQFVSLPRIEGVKIISTEKPSLGGTNLDDAFAKMFASNF